MACPVDGGLDTESSGYIDGNATKSHIQHPWLESSSKDRTAEWVLRRLL